MEPYTHMLVVLYANGLYTYWSRYTYEQAHRWADALLAEDNIVGIWVAPNV